MKSVHADHDTRLKDLQDVHDREMNKFDDKLRLSERTVKDQQRQLDSLGEETKEKDVNIFEMKKEISSQKELLSESKYQQNVLSETLENAKNREVKIIENYKEQIDGITNEKDEEIKSLLNVVSELQNDKTDAEEK